VALVMGSYPFFGRRGVRKRDTTASPAAAAALALALAVSAAPAHAAAPDATDWAAIQRYEAELRTNPSDLFEGAAYRQLMIRYGQYDRAIAFFRHLAADHRNLAPVHVNLAFAYIDKIPTVGRIRQGFLGKDAIEAFGTSIRSQPTWIAYYMRGLVNLYYDRILNRVRPAIADFEQAIRVQHAEAKQPFHVRAFISLGDAYWKLGNLAKARSAWSDGLNEFPGDAALTSRLAAKPGPELYRVIESGLDASRRQDTSLRELARRQP